MTEIAFILDRSGSMESLRATAIDGFNNFLRDQKAVGTDACFTLVLFDNRYEVPFRATPIGEVTALTPKTFEPRGTTALLDAIGQTIDDVGARLAAMPESERPKQVIVAILTDGLENASTRFTQREIADKIAHQRDKYSWQFYFLAANQDAIATAAKIEIYAECAASYDATIQGLTASNRTLSRKVASSRKAAAGRRLSAQEQADLHAPLSEIAEDEMRRSGE